jgi:hypothetical protein
MNLSASRRRTRTSSSAHLRRAQRSWSPSTGQPLEKGSKDTDRHFILTAEGLQSNRVVDEVIARPKDHSRACIGDGRSLVDETLLRESWVSVPRRGGDSGRTFARPRSTRWPRWCGHAGASGVAIQGDGKIVAVGHVLAPDLGGKTKFALARYLAALGEGPANRMPQTGSPGNSRPWELARVQARGGRRFPGF